MDKTTRVNSGIWTRQRASLVGVGQKCLLFFPEDSTRFVAWLIRWIREMNVNWWAHIATTAIYRRRIVERVNHGALQRCQDELCVA